MAELTVTESIIDGITILGLDGRISIGEGSVALRSAIHRALSQNVKKIILDMAGVKYIDSSGVGELVSTFTACSKNECIICCANLTQPIEDLFKANRFIIIFGAYASVLDAVKSIKDTSFAEHISNLK